MIHLDSGDLLDHDYVEKMIPFFYANKKIGIVGSRYTSYKINSPFQNYASLFENELSLFYVGATQYQNTVMPGAGIVYSKQAIYDIGKWPNFMCEDGAMSFQMMQKGYDVL
jgi:cellulose synthase/poly-beta-1,6-N-acetylglucosamine synthase-like glycosyltransferase